MSIDPGTVLFGSDGAGDQPAPWRSRAVCAQTDPDAFFPEKGGSTREAKRICVDCDVKAECLLEALEHDERFGIWGGLSERERRRLVRVALLDSVHNGTAPQVTKKPGRKREARVPRVSAPKAAVAVQPPVLVQPSSTQPERKAVESIPDSVPQVAATRLPKTAGATVEAPPRRRGSKRRAWLQQTVRQLAQRLQHPPTYVDLLAASRADGGFDPVELLDYWPSMNVAIREALATEQLKTRSA